MPYVRGFFFIDIWKMKTSTVEPFSVSNFSHHEKGPLKYVELA